MHREPRTVPGADRAPAPDGRIDRARPFHIAVEQHVLDDLQRRLDGTRWARVGPEAGWDLGTSREYLRDLVAYWRTGYDWRAQEGRLDQIPQYVAELDDLALHFAHVKARMSDGATPVLLLHGWPDSFDRYHRVMPMLASGGCDVVVPSLPGFGFTRWLGEVRREQPMRHTATALWRLMTEVLGYRRFVIAGGDGGSVIAQILAIDHPESVIGIHVTDLGWHASQVDHANVTRPERKYLERAGKAFLKDGAYAMVQATRPRSLAVGLTDSPVGLASWIVDRFHSWSDGKLDERFGKDVLLTNIMLYWVTGTIGSSMYGYHAETVSPSLTAADRVDRPVAVALFPDDIGGIPPRRLAERTLEVVRWTEMPRGGHFAALEEPALYAHDVLELVRSLTRRDDDRPTA
jgi:pimeloyl-ACP methyl ester carboxylesterase